MTELSTTTVEMHHVPHKCTKVDLMQLFNGRGFEGAYNMIEFFDMSLLETLDNVDLGDCGVFINFNTANSANRFIDRFDGFKGWATDGAQSVVNVVASDSAKFWATLQKRLAAQASVKEGKVGGA